MMKKLLMWMKERNTVKIRPAQMKFKIKRRIWKAYPAHGQIVLPNLEGDIKDIRDGQFTAIEAITGKSDNGGDVIVLSGDGDDSEFNKVTVIYGENTLFAVKTIYDGGARSETTEATSLSLAADQLVEVWGNSSGSGLKATQICIVKVV